MKCYYHEDKSGVKEFYFADSRNQARNYFSEKLGIPYIDVKIYRAMWADAYNDSTMTPKLRLQHGQSVYCWDCSNIIDPYDVYFADDKGRCRCRKCHAINKVKGFFGRGE